MTEVGNEPVKVTASHLATRCFPYRVMHISVTLRAAKNNPHHVAERTMRVAGVEGGCVYSSLSRLARNAARRHHLRGNDQGERIHTYPSSPPGTAHRT